MVTKRLFTFALMAFVAFAAMFIAPDAMAETKNFTDVFNKVTTTVTSGKKFALQIAALAGVIFFVGGLLLINKDSKQPGQNHMRNGFVGLIIGAALLAAPKLMSTTVNTALDDADVSESTGNF